jgi:hypothetical protein
MIFLSGRRYAGVTYNQLACWVGIDAARASGVHSLYTCLGKPKDEYSACEWVELPYNSVKAAEVVLRLCGRLPVHEARWRGKCVYAGRRWGVKIAFRRGGNIIARR